MSRRLWVGCGFLVSFGLFGYGVFLINSVFGVPSYHYRTESAFRNFDRAQEFFRLENGRYAGFAGDRPKLELSSGLEGVPYLIRFHPECQDLDLSVDVAGDQSILDVPQKALAEKVGHRLGEVLPLLERAKACPDLRTEYRVVAIGAFAEDADLHVWLLQSGREPQLLKGGWVAPHPFQEVRRKGSTFAFVGFLGFALMSMVVVVQVVQFILNRARVERH